MKITFLGTNGWYSTKTGNTVCTLLESEKYYIVFDAGDGIYKLDKYIKTEKPIYLFLSHLHLDHVYGFHIIGKFNFKNKFFVILGKDREKYLNKLANPPYAVNFRKFRYNPKVITVPQKNNSIPFGLEYKKLFHAHSSLGFRLNLGGKTIVHCLDSGICENSLKLSQEADVLIHECSNLPGSDSGNWGHTNPEEAAELAKKAKVKKLILTHFSPDLFLTLNDRQVAQKKARKIFKNTLAAKDGMMIKV